MKAAAGAGEGTVKKNAIRNEAGIAMVLVVWALAAAAPDYVYTLNKIAGLLAGCLIIWLFSRHRTILFPESETRFPVYSSG